MIALDTNILVRMIVQDDVQQADLAERLIQQATEQGETCFVSDPVLCEVEWVLESVYDAQRGDILAVMQELAARKNFVFEDQDAFRQAIDLYQASKVDFSDALIGAISRARGARTTYTFDRVLSRHQGFSRLN